MAKTPPPPTPAPEPKKSERTRAAILDAARELFAQRGFAATTVRDVAAAAGIDPALVIRYFGSKDELFVRAAEFQLSLAPVAQADPEQVGEALVRHFIGVWEGPQANAGMAVLLRSAASNEMSAQKLQEVFATQVLPVIAKLGTRSTAGRRAGLVATQLLGLALCRYVLRIPPVVEMDAADIVRFVGPTIQRYARET